MQPLLGICGLLLAGAITPGPNTLVVMRLAARAGWTAALPAILGVASGSAALLTVVAAGGGAALAAVPGLAAVIAGGGCLYLSWLGARLISGSFSAGGRADRAAEHDSPHGVAGLFVFQFLNPKAWVLAATAVTVAQPSLGTATLPVLVTLLALISTACLTLWSCLGLLMGRRRDLSARSHWLERAMGALLITSAAALLVGL